MSEMDYFEFHNSIKTCLGKLEANPHLHLIEKVLNGKISSEEVDKMIRKSKCREAVNTTDPLPSEIFKNPISTELGISLSTFRKGTVNPIPKGTGKGQRVPPNHRGIPLLSCAGKLHSAVESNYILVEDQNGFKKYVPPQNTHFPDNRLEKSLRGGKRYILLFY